jgi:hypothetical protein
MGVNERYQDADETFRKENFDEIINSYINDGSWQFLYGSVIQIGTDYYEGKGGSCYIMKVLK